MSFTREAFLWICKECGKEIHWFTLDCNTCHRVRDRPSADWTCPKCNVLIFASKDRCKKCDSKKGDWKCNGCDYVNFGTRKSCKSCNQEKEKKIPVL